MLSFPEREIVTGGWVEECKRAGVEFVEWATLTDLERAGDRIREARFVEDQGDELRVRASEFVLAAGGIENSRQLLLPAETGVLRENPDLIGRWFTDHPHGWLGVLEPRCPIEELAFYDFRVCRDTVVLGVHQIGSAVARDEAVLSFSLTMYGRAGHVVGPANRSLTRLVNAARERCIPEGLWKHVSRVARDPRAVMAGLSERRPSQMVHHTALGGWSNPETALTDVSAVAVEGMFAQRPSRANRVRLGEARDRLGRHKPHLEWSWSRTEVEAYWRATDLVGRQLRPAGTWWSPAEMGSGSISNGGTGWHHMGGTRMALDSADGVVDEWGKVHELENLHVAGSSLFPSSAGWANPMWTLIALAIRLGDRLSSVAGPMGDPAP